MSWNKILDNMKVDERVLPQDRDQPFCALRLADYIRDINRWTSFAERSAELGFANFAALKNAEAAVQAALAYAAKSREEAQNDCEMVGQK